ncbi:MAG: hypothetical protein IJ048_05775 [Clostridia bacterium]|nr:hypothetical protein [Clostridia bacterium]
MSLDEMLFFDGKPQALALYERLRAAILAEIGAEKIEVRKTQISFKNRHLFAAVSFLPVRRAKERPAAYITLTFGLRYRHESPRIDAAVEARPGRWTHHARIGSAAEIDAELMGWVVESAAAADAR